MVKSIPDAEDVTVPVADEEPYDSTDEGETETEVEDNIFGDIVRETKNKE